jgi:translocation and assembly module TamA
VDRWLQITVLLAALALPAAAQAYVRPVCNGYRIDSEKIIKFNANEKKLICGDPDAESWKEIPRFQAEYFIRTFLQQRGYFYPEFREEKDLVTIIPGEQTYVTDIEVEGEPPEQFKVWKRRQIRGGLLTPDALNALEGWSKGQLKNWGYACPQVKSRADAETGEVRLNLDPGQAMSIIDVDEEPVDGLMPGTLRRFDAFRLGHPYKHLNLSLTSRRIAKDGILQSSYFLTECTPEGARLTQKSIPGAKRLVSVGFGASTEEYFIIKAMWKQSRIGKNGSSFVISGRGSYRKQRLFVEGFVYPFPFPTRWHFAPSFLTRRENQDRYEYVANDLWVPMAYTWDTLNTSFRLAFGPKLNFTNTFKGATSGWTHFLSAAAGFDVASHDYEYYIVDPRTGYVVSAMAELNSDEVLSSITAQKLTISGQTLWNIAGFDPPLFILGIRGLAGTTITDYDSPKFARLPPQFLYYLGGSATMRGFSRRSLPKTIRGALSSLYAGAELRLANILPLNIQPIAFVDVGVMGARSFDLDAPGYWSPGFGVRWPSIIGVVRLTVARGYLIRNSDPANNGLSGWQFYWSLGEEF